MAVLQSSGSQVSSMFLLYFLQHGASILKITRWLLQLQPSSSQSSERYRKKKGSRQRGLFSVKRALLKTCPYIYYEPSLSFRQNWEYKFWLQRMLPLITSKEDGEKAELIFTSTAALWLK